MLRGFSPEASRVRHHESRRHLTSWDNDRRFLSWLSFVSFVVKIIGGEVATAVQVCGEHLHLTVRSAFSNVTRL